MKQLKKRRAIWVVVGGFLMLGAFQNCSPFHSSGKLDSSSTGGTAMNQSAGPFACEPGADPAPVVMRRLTKTEYVNTLTALLSRLTAADRSAVLFGLGPLIEAIPNDAAAKFARTDSTLDQARVSAYFYTADKLGELLTATDARAKAFFGVCGGLSDLSAACLDQFLAGFAAKIYRRPLTAAEMATLRTDFAAYAAGARNSALITRLFTSPRFLMLVEDGGNEVSPGLLQISPYELASRLSYHFLSTMPDDDLMTAAANGSLMQDSVLQAQIGRMQSGTNLAATQATLAEFYSQWLGLSSLPLVENSGGAHFDAFAGGASLSKASMIQEIQDMVNYYTFTQAGNFSDLLTSPFSFARSTDLAAIYGVAPWSGNTSQMVRLPAGERSGLMTRAAFLVTGAAETNPVKRGLAIRRNVLCDVIPSPPVSVQNMVRVPEPDATLSTRERFEHKTSPSLCMGCHANINPLGFALEGFDALGRFRTSEKIFDEAGTFLAERRVNTLVQPMITPDNLASTSDAVEFSQLMADAGKAQKCFVQQYFNFTYRQPADVALDGCALEDMRQNLMGPSGSLKKALTAVPLSRAFKLKNISP